MAEFNIMNEIIQYLETHGEGLDAEIALAVGLNFIECAQATSRNRG